MTISRGVKTFHPWRHDQKTYRRDFIRKCDCMGDVKRTLFNRTFSVDVVYLVANVNLGVNQFDEAEFHSHVCVSTLVDSFI